MDSPEHPPAPPLSPAMSPTKRGSSFLLHPVDSMLDTIKRIASHDSLTKLGPRRASSNYSTENEFSTASLVDGDESNEPDEEKDDDFKESVHSVSPKLRRNRTKVAFDPVVHVDKGKDGTLGQENVAFEEESETDRVAPLRRVSQKPEPHTHHSLNKDLKHTKFSIGGESSGDMVRQRKISEGVSGGFLERMRKTGSRDSLVHGYFRRSASVLSFASSTDGGKAAARAGSIGESYVDMDGFRVADVEEQIAERALTLHRGVSNPVFQIYTDDDDEEEQPRVRRPSRRSRVSVHMMQARIKRKMSFGYNALETLPSAAHYAVEKTMQRPTLDDLRKEQDKHEDELVRNTGNETSVAPQGKLGWILGVVLWTLQDMWAVQLFLRLGWMTAQAGIGLYTLVVLISTAIALLTALSTSAIATNGDIGIGGTYFLIARSLGPAYGAGIGVMFSLANVINCALNVQGLADVVTSIMATYHAKMLNRLDDTRIIAVIALVGITAVALMGMLIGSRLKLLCLVLLLAGVVNIIVGSIIPPDEHQQAEGFVGYSNALFRENWYPAFQDDQFGAQNFLTVFAVFFPSMTGILAGTSITGDLRDPAGAIPKGSIVATFLAAMVYLIVGWIAAAVNLRHASGSLIDLHTGNLTGCELNHTCRYGLINDMEILAINCHFRPIFLAATFAATVSTSLGCIHFAPKVFQALCRDKIFPYIGWFGKGYGHHDEPYRAYFLVMVISIAFLMPSDFNFISNIVSNSFLLTFALINYATFDASFSKSPGWRPMFKYYNQWLSLFSAVLCLAFMFALDWKSAIIVFAFILILWLYVFYKKPNVSWGTFQEAGIYQSALTDLLKLQKIQDHVKNFRPQILLLTGLPVVRPGLVYLANSITAGAGLLICGQVLVEEEQIEGQVLEQEVYKWFRKRKIRAFYENFAADSTAEGIRALIQTCGLGKMRPNILMMGFHENWKKLNAASVDDYVNVIDDAFDSHRGVIIACAVQGFDMTHLVNFEQVVRENALPEAMKQGYSGVGAEENEVPLPLECLETSDPDSQARIDLAEWLKPGKKKKVYGEIHVWWLYDDGGLTILVPYLMSKHSPWNGSRLRVFCLADKDGNLEQAKSNMADLLNKFRIKVCDITAVDLDQPASKESVDAFSKVISEYRQQTDERLQPAQITDDDMAEYGTRTKRQIRLNELLRQHSAHAHLTVVTLPPPQRTTCPTLYLAILDSMTTGQIKGPTLLIRGNHEDVLTYNC